MLIHRKSYKYSGVNTAYNIHVQMQIFSASEQQKLFGIHSALSTK